MKERTITIPLSDVFFDVDASTHIFANVAEVSGLQRADGLESDTDDSSRKAEVTRFADRRVAELKRELARFIKTETLTSHSVTITTGATFTIVLYVEDAFQDELLVPLAAEMESYIANGVIADWYNTVGDSQSASYIAQLPAIINRIVALIVARKIPSRS